MSLTFALYRSPLLASASSTASMVSAAAFAGSGCGRPFLSSSNSSAVACGPGDHRMRSEGKWTVSSCSRAVRSEEATSRDR